MALEGRPAKDSESRTLSNRLAKGVGPDVATHSDCYAGKRVLWITEPAVARSTTG